MATRLTSEDVKQIIAEYPNELASVLAKKYKVTAAKIYSTAKRYKVKKSAEFLKSDRCCRIKPGQHLAPETEIKPGQQIFGKRVRNKPKQPHPTAWRKGNVPLQTAKNGAIRWRTVGWMIRIDQNKWMFYTRWLWIQNHGEIPEAYNVIYKQGFSSNKKNRPTIDQLECVSNTDLIGINSGRNALTDEYVVAKLSHFKPELKPMVSQMPNLIELKRNELKLRRIINELTETTTND